MIQEIVPAKLLLLGEEAGTNLSEFSIDNYIMYCLPHLLRKFYDVLLFHPGYQAIPCPHLYGEIAEYHLLRLT